MSAYYNEHDKGAAAWLRKLISRGLIARHGRTGIWRCSGEELAALRASVIEADQVLPLLRTDQLTAALATVYAAMDRIEAAQA